jgi:hypothetical protein
MKTLRNAVLGTALAVAAAGLAIANPITLFTGPVPPQGVTANPVAQTQNLSDYNLIVNAANTAFAPANVGITPLANGHMVTANNPPVLTSCGTTPAIVGSDFAGLVTMGTGTPTGCVITFATAYTAVPLCVVTWQGTPLVAQNWTTTATAITLVQTATSSNKVNYICVGQAGG